MTARQVTQYACEVCQDTGLLDDSAGACPLCLAGRASREMQAHFDARMRMDFDRVFIPANPTSTVQKTQEGRVIRVVADEGICTRDSVG